MVTQKLSQSHQNSKVYFAKQVKNKVWHALATGTIILALTQFDCQRKITKKYLPVEIETTINFTASSKRCYAQETLDEAIIEYENQYGVTPESLKTRALQKYFTQQAFKELNKIPIVQGEVYEGCLAQATGRNFLINCGQTIEGYGWGMKTIIADEKKLTDNIICHEYIHHASALELINDTEFANAWKKMSENSQYNTTIITIDDEITKCYPQKIMRLIPKWRTIEQEAKLAEKILFEKTLILPEMKKVYEKTLKF